jgi:hypothetical protein
MAFVATAVTGIGGALLGAGTLGGAGLLGGGIAGALAGGLGGAALGSSIGGTIAQQQAAKQAANIAGNLQYQPIDLDALQKQAQGVAEENIQKSLALEQQYLPGIAASRAGLQGQVAADLSRGGNLPPDVINQVTKASMAQAGSGGFGAGPLTAANLGLTAYDIRQRAQQRAADLLAQNPLPVSGLDPGSLASAAIGQNQQANQFELGKAGALTNAIQSKADASSALAGTLGSVASIYGGVKPSTAAPSTIPSLPSAASIYANTPALQPGFSNLPAMSFSTTTTPTTIRSNR